jgi:hypothetical protein
MGEGSNNGGGESVIFAGQPMAAVLTYASRQPGTLSETDEGNATEGHALEQITLDANDLANFSAFAPAIWGAQWKSVSFRHGLIAGLYIGYGWIHTIEDCAFKNNAVANLYLDRAINAVNVLNNNFAASAGVGIVANGGEALRIVGNCFQSLGGPAIYANQMGALTVSGSYYEANNQRAANYTWPGLPAGVADGGLCAEVVLNGAGNQTPPGRWSELIWSTNPARLALLVAKGPAGVIDWFPSTLSLRGIVCGVLSGRSLCRWAAVCDGTATARGWEPVRLSDDRRELPQPGPEPMRGATILRGVRRGRDRGVGPEQ